jgi:hypothetical protein
MTVASPSSWTPNPGVSAPGRRLADDAVDLLVHDQEERSGGAVRRVQHREEVREELPAGENPEVAEEIGRSDVHKRAATLDGFHQELVGV